LNPVLAEVIRGGAVESRHRGAVVAKNADGKTVLSIGDTSALVFPRSSLKPLQVIPLVESGAVEQFGISESELALACASHNSAGLLCHSIKKRQKRFCALAAALVASYIIVPVNMWEC